MGVESILAPFRQAEIFRPILRRYCAYRRLPDQKERLTTTPTLTSPAASSEPPRPAGVPEGAGSWSRSPDLELAVLGELKAAFGKAQLSALGLVHQLLLLAVHTVAPSMRAAGMTPSVAVAGRQ